MAQPPPPWGSAVTSIDPALGLAALVLGGVVALGVLVAWVRGASVTGLFGISLAGTLLALVTLSAISLGGFAAVVLGIAFLTEWMTLFLLVRRFRRRAGGKGAL